MISIRAAAVAATLALSAVGAANAAPVIAPGDSSIFFNNFENLYRPTANCSGNLCLAAVAGDPAGYRRINPAIANNVRINDVFVGVLNIQNITSATSGSDTYNSVPGDRFTGYFAQRVANISGALSTATITLGTAVDPFGILAAGEMFRLFSSVPSFTSGGSATDVTASIASATAGVLWAGLGLGTEGYAYTRTDLTLPVASSNTEAFLALDTLLKGPGYSAGLLNKLNDFNEDVVGGTIANPASQLCSPAELANPGISCTDFVGTSEIEANNLFQSTSPWMFASNDPFDLNRALPEPGSLALVGFALAGLGVSLRRRSSAKSSA